MKVGQKVYYITGGKLHYGEILYNDNGTLVIREKKRVARILKSRVAWEVSDECKRSGLQNNGNKPL